MNLLFEKFTSRLTAFQLDLLLDTVQYFEDAPKFLAIPNETGERISVPLKAGVLREMLSSFSDEDENKVREFTFSFAWTDPDAQVGVVTVLLPNGDLVRQDTAVKEFSEV